MSILQSILIFLGAILVGVVVGFTIFYFISKAKTKPAGMSAKTTALSMKIQESTAPDEKDFQEILVGDDRQLEPEVEETTVIPVTEEPAVVPISEEPTAVPVSEEPVPISEEPVVVPVSEEPVPISEEPTPVSVSEEPVVIPVSEEPNPVSVSEEYAVTREQEPAVNDDIYKEIVFNLTVATTPWAGKLTAFQTSSWQESDLENVPSLKDFREDIAQAYIDIHLANSIVWVANETGLHSAELDESYKQLCDKIAERLKKVIALPNNAKL